MHINILDKDDSYKEHIDKLVEEVREACEELDYLDIQKNVVLKNHIRYAAGEVLDVIQVCVGILDNLKDKGLDIERAIEFHNDKLAYRGWKFKGIIKIEVDYDDKDSSTRETDRQGQT